MDPLVRLAMRESRGDTAADYASYVSCSLDLSLDVLPRRLRPL